MTHANVIARVASHGSHPGLICILTRELDIPGLTSCEVKSMSKRVLVLGATGTLGGPVATSLVSEGYRVRVLVRDASKVSSLKGDAEIIQGSPLDSNQLAAAAEGCYAVHVSLSPEVELMAVEALRDVAVKAGVERVSLISGTTVCEENRWFRVVDTKMRSEIALRSSGIPHTVFCPTWVMEVLRNFVKEKRAVIIHGRNPPPLHFFAAKDLGRIVAASYGDDRAIGKRLFVHGPEAYTLPEALKLFFATYDPDLPIMNMKLWQASLLATVFRMKMRTATDLIGYFDKIGEIGDPTETNELFGAPQTTLEEWATEEMLNAKC